MYKDNLWGSSSSFRGWGGHRTRRGDMAPIILRVLSKKPMHGYEIISHLEEKSHGMWRPSAGSVYPNLQLLEEQELVTSKSEDGKKIYSLTKKGEEEAKKVEEHFKEHWAGKESNIKNFKELKLTFVETIHILKQISAQDSEKKNTAVQKILNDTKDKLAKLLNEDVEK